MKRIAIVTLALTLSACCGPWKQLPHNPDYEPLEKPVESRSGEESNSPASYNAEPIETEMPETDRTKVQSRGTSFSDQR